MASGPLFVGPGFEICRGRLTIREYTPTIVDVNWVLAALFGALRGCARS